MIEFLLAESNPQSPIWVNVLENQGLIALLLIFGGPFVWKRLFAEETGYVTRLVDNHIGFVDTLEKTQSSIKETLEATEKHCKQTATALDNMSEQQQAMNKYLEMQCDSTLFLMDENKKSRDQKEKENAT